MGETHPLAKRLRDARDARKPPLSNRKIAELANVSPATVDRLMRGQVDTKVGNIDAIADVLGVPRREARKLSGLPPTDGDPPYTGPEESRLLNRKQRAALDELIRAFLASSTIASDDGRSVVTIPDRVIFEDVVTRVDKGPAEFELVARPGDSVGRRMRDVQDADAEENQDQGG